MAARDAIGWDFAEAPIHYNVQTLLDHFKNQCHLNNGQRTQDYQNT